MKNIEVMVKVREKVIGIITLKQDLRLKKQKEEEIVSNVGGIRNCENKEKNLKQSRSSGLVSQLMTIWTLTITAN